MSNSVAEKIDELLKSDKTFSTRNGMLFLTQLVRDAFKYIETEQEKNGKEDERLKDLEERFTDFQKTFNAFLEARKIEQDKAEDDRKWWRRAMLAPIFGILIAEIARLILGH